MWRWLWSLFISSCKASWMGLSACQCPQLCHSPVLVCRWKATPFQHLRWPAAIYPVILAHITKATSNNTGWTVTEITGVVNATDASNSYQAPRVAQLQRDIAYCLLYMTNVNHPWGLRNLPIFLSLHENFLWLLKADTAGCCKLHGSSEDVLSAEALISAKR